MVVTTYTNEKGELKTYSVITTAEIPIDIHITRESIREKLRMQEENNFTETCCNTNPHMHPSKYFEDGTVKIMAKPSMEELLNSLRKQTIEAVRGSYRGK